MAVVFGGVLLCSFGLQKLFSPAGDAAVRAVDGRPVILTGTVSSAPPEGRLVFQDGATTYTLADPVKARPYAGRKVRISGTLHEATGLLDIAGINSILDHGANAQ